MTHPPMEVLIQHTLGMSTGEGNHITTCDHCAEEVDQLVKIVETATPRPAPAELLELERLEATVTSAAGGPAELRAALAEIPSLRRKDPSAALRKAEEIDRSLGVAAEGEELKELKANALRELACSVRVMGDYDRAEELLDQAERLAETLSIASDYVTARVWFERANLCVTAEKEGGSHWAAKAAEIFRLYGDQSRYLRSQYLVAAEHFNQRRYQTAIEMLRELIRLSDRAGDRSTLPMIWGLLGHALTRNDEIGQAEQAFMKALELYGETEMPIARLQVLWGLARARLKAGRFQESLDTLERIRSRFRELGLDEEYGLSGLDLTEAMLLAGAPDRARRVCVESLDILGSRFDGREQQRALAYLREIGTSLDPLRLGYVASYLHESATDPELRFSPPT